MRLERWLQRAKLERFGHHRPRSTAHLFGPGTSIVAHRGGAGVAPENTLAAFRRARDRGFPIELDVAPCGSGELVVFHDDDLGRTTNGRGRLADTPLAALRALDAGAWFGPAFAGERVPTLAEVLAEVGRDVLLDVEIKPVPDRRRVAYAVVDLLAEARLLDRALVTSFDPRILAHVRARAPELRRGQIYARLTRADLAHPERLALRTLLGNPLAEPDVLVVEHPIVDADYLAAMKGLGYRVWTWTVNDPAEAARALALGVDAVITDHPERMDRGSRDR